MVPTMDSVQVSAVGKAKSLLAPLAIIFAAMLGAKVSNRLYIGRGTAALPPSMPPGSPAYTLPPWPVFNLAVRLNGFFSYLADITTPPDVRLHKMAGATWVVSGYVPRALALHGIPDAIAAAAGAPPGGGRSTVVEIAARTGTNPKVLARYLDAAEKMGLVTKLDDVRSGGRDDAAKAAFRLTRTGDLLREDVVGSLRDVVLMMGQSYVHDANRAAGEVTFKAGEATNPRSGFLEAHGAEVYDWFANGHLAEMARFDRTMTAYGAGMSAAIVADWTPPSDDFKFCDIAGGRGTTLAVILRHYPKAHGCVFDRPEVVPAAREYLAEQGLSDRSHAIGGDLFDSSTMKELEDCDVFLLKWIIHNWDDESSVRVLRNLRSVGRSDRSARLLVGDFVIGSSSIHEFELAKAQADIFMLSMNTFGAKERSEADFRRLFDAAGYSEKHRLITLRNPLSLLEVKM